MNQGALAIFVKTAGHSPLKTRLASECGERVAVEWYRLAAAAVASVARIAQTQFGLAAFWAVAEPDALDAWTGLPAMAQGDGSLGARMARVHAQLVSRHGFGMLLGADVPHITSMVLGDAAQWLSSHEPRLALGPAVDGGFWLFGANTAPPMALWEQVRYSEVDTASELQRCMSGIGEWLILPRLTDADHARDLPSVYAGLQALRDATPEQQALARWMSQRIAGLT